MNTTTAPADRLNHSAICITLSNAAEFYAPDYEAPSADGLSVQEFTTAAGRAAFLSMYHRSTENI